jgi:chemotaxis response regulator CheB
VVLAPLRNIHPSCEAGQVPSDDTRPRFASTRQQISRQSFRLLVVDDHAAYRSTVSECFLIHDRVGSVDQADSVRAALRVLERSELEHSQPDLVVMDVRMPITNGIDGALEVLSRYPSVRVVLCSTSGANELPELSSIPFESGRVMFVEKSHLEPDSIMAWLIDSNPPRVDLIDLADP